MAKEISYATHGLIFYTYPSSFQIGLTIAGREWFSKIAYGYNLQSLLINGMLHMGFELLLLWFCVLLVVFAALPAPVDIGALAKVVEFFAVFD
jgi:hypothetical protein